MSATARSKVAPQIASPFRFEGDFTPSEFKKLGQLALRWAHIEHIIGNCIKALLGITDEQAESLITPMSMEVRINRLLELSKLANLSDDDGKLFAELVWAAKAVHFTRNTVFHGVLMEDKETGSLRRFELRNKKRRQIAMTQVLELENITNYAAHAALLSRHALGGKPSQDAPPPLPDRPPIPKNLPLGFPMPPTQKEVKRKRQPKSSRQ